MTSLESSNSYVCAHFVTAGRDNVISATGAMDLGRLGNPVHQA